MKPFLIIFLFFFAISASAQNIVSNPNFTIYSACPNTVSQIEFATGWRRPTAGTSDYFNACTTDIYISIPTNFFGTQNTPSGAYVGALAFLYDTSNNPREYIATDIPSLVPGAIYKVTITVSLSDQSYYACDGLGVYFYKNLVPDSTTYDVIPVTPQIDYSSFGIISDKLNWITLSKYFTPDSSYTHLIVGNFKNNKTTAYFVPDSTINAYMGYSYFYCNYVAVEKVHTTIVTDLTLPISAAIYPNPFLDHCTLSFDNVFHQPYQLFVYNIQGALVRQVDNITTSEITIQRDQMENGIYFYQLRGPDNAVIRGKMIIQ